MTDCYSKEPHNPSTQIPYTPYGRCLRRDRQSRIVLPMIPAQCYQWWMVEHGRTIFNHILTALEPGLWCRGSRPPLTSCQWQLAKNLPNHSAMALPFNNIGPESKRQEQGNSWELMVNQYPKDLHTRLNKTGLDTTYSWWHFQILVQALFVKWNVCHLSPVFKEA